MDDAISNNSHSRSNPQIQASKDVTRRLTRGLAGHPEGWARTRADAAADPETPPQSGGLGPDEPAVRERLHRELWSDIDGGRRPDIRGYLDRYPEIEDEVIQEFAANVSQPSPASAPPGRCVEGYRILHRLGRGGHAEVWLARDPSGAKNVAVKILSRSGGGTPSSIVRFRREAKILQQLRDPAICEFIAIIEEPEAHYLVMEYVEGKTLEHCLRELDRRPQAGRVALGSPLWHLGPGVAAMIDMLERTADALHRVHEKHIVHRDIKPANIIIGPDQEPVILDFGLARMREDHQVPLTEPGDVFGTLHYMAPEQLSGALAPQASSPRNGRGPGDDDETVDRRADVYALGVILYEVVTGRRPFEGLSKQAIKSAIMRASPEPPHLVNQDVPRELSRLIMLALEKERRHRVPTARALAENLRRIKNGLGVDCEQPGPVGRALNWIRRNKRASVLGTTIFAVLVTSLALALHFMSAAHRALWELERLDDGTRLQALRADSSDLWPVTPSTLTAIESWLVRANKLRDKRRAYQRLDPDESTEGFLQRLDTFFEPGGEYAGVEKRAAEIRRAQKVSLDDSAGRWEEVRRRVQRDQRYQDLQLAPQFGLVPLGPDPDTKLEEFACVLTGDVPRRDQKHRLVRDTSMGLVLVLLPPGNFVMGASPKGEVSEVLKPKENEREHREVVLKAFFLSKYEMTQAQWHKCTGENPSVCQPESTSVSFLHPVENISWHDAHSTLSRLGLQLPTEAQWEYAARGKEQWDAASVSVFFTGNDIASLRGFANLADQSSVNNEHGWAPEPGFQDSYPLHADVTVLRPNPFGLHHVLGNVWEWCEDHLLAYELLPREGDGLRAQQTETVRHRVFRGGAYTAQAASARSAARAGADPRLVSFDLGVRPARRIEP